MNITIRTLNRCLSFYSGQNGYCKCRFLSKRYYVSSFLLGNDTTSIAHAINFSASSRSSELGTQIHAHLTKLGFKNDMFCYNNLIKMYYKCGFFSDARKVFDEMTKRNVISWTLIISGANQNGFDQVALGTFVDMIRSGVLPNEFALGSAMKACTSIGVVELSLCVHCFALKIGMEKNPFVVSSIMHAYVMCGNVESAEQVLGSMDSSDVGCWNAMIGGYAQCGYGLEAVKAVSFMHSEGLPMDEFTFVNALTGCSVKGDPDFGCQIHGLIIRSGFELNTSVVNSLMDMYLKNYGRDPALQLFYAMKEKDVVSWNIVFAGLSENVNAREVVCLFHRLMVTNLKPNHITFSILFRACRDVHELCLGLQFFGVAFRFGLHAEASLSASLINMLSRCGTTKMARALFETLPSININIWNEMISAYNWSSDPEALELFCNMQHSGVKANTCTYSCVLEACFKSGNVQAGRQLHGIVVKSGLTSDGYVCSSLIQGYVNVGLLHDSYAFFNGLEQLEVASWGALISALVHQGYNLEAVKFLNYLKDDGKEPDEFILGSILNGCSTLASYHLTTSVHSHVIRMGFETHAFVSSAVIDAYAKCGDIESGKTAFNQSYKSGDLVLFNTMIMAYARHGLIIEAFQVFGKMKVANLKPSQATFVSVLSACCYMGQVDLGRKIFKSITLDYDMEPSPDNYGCLVDMLSRYGFIQEAKYVIETMPVPPWPAIWRSLLNGCRIHGDRELGEYASKKFFHLFPENDAAYVLLSKVYSEDGDWEGAANLRREMIQRGTRKDLGRSWIEA